MSILSRRNFLIASALLGGSSYVYQRGLRYPRLSLEPDALPSYVNTHKIDLLLHDLISTDHKGTIHLRAIAPEPRIDLIAQRGEHLIQVNNIAANAQLNIVGRGIKLIDEERDGINRTIKLDCAIEQAITLHWQLPVDDGFEFATIGDTGGGDELAWALQRATQLNAQFLLHLGDFNYGGSEYEQALNQFSRSDIPCYVSIGNHDFNDSGLVYQKFLQQLGPMNNAFTLAGTQFINMDTAACFYPVHSGHRATLFSQLQKQPHEAFDNRIIFTHRPLKDPRPQHDHASGSSKEIKLLAQQARGIKCNDLLAGHVHHSSELDFEGLKQRTAGEGLGHEDIVSQHHVAQILLGKVEPAMPIDYRWVNLDMPWSFHTSHTHEKKLIKDQRNKQLAWYHSLSEPQNAQDNKQMQLKAS